MLDVLLKVVLVLVGQGKIALGNPNVAQELFCELVLIQILRDVVSLLEGVHYDLPVLLWLAPSRRLGLLLVVLGLQHGPDGVADAQQSVQLQPKVLQRLADLQASLEERKGLAAVLAEEVGQPQLASTQALRSVVPFLPRPVQRLLEVLDGLCVLLHESQRDPAVVIRSVDIV